MINAPPIKPQIVKYPIPISQLCLVNTDVPAGVGAPPLDTTSVSLCEPLTQLSAVKVSSTNRMARSD